MSIYGRGSTYVIDRPKIFVGLVLKWLKWSCEMGWSSYDEDQEQLMDDMYGM